jgi:hypothetical protein
MNVFLPLIMENAIVKNVKLIGNIVLALAPFAKNILLNYKNVFYTKINQEEESFVLTVPPL